MSSSISRAIPSSVLRLAPTVPFTRVEVGVAKLVEDIAEGRNPHVRFPFKELRLPRGYEAHPPNTDRFEVRPSVSMEFLGTPQGRQLVHVFHDGTIKTREKMLAENNARTAEDSRLAADEGHFPTLVQTTARRQAYARMIQRIQELRSDRTQSVMAKEVEKSNAILEYRTLLQAQARARVVAAAAQAARQGRYFPRLGDIGEEYIYRLPISTVLVHQDRSREFSRTETQRHA